jgi:hypothetical protein
MIVIPKLCLIKIFFTWSAVVIVRSFLEIDTLSFHHEKIQYIDLFLIEDNMTVSAQSALHVALIQGTDLLFAFLEHYYFDVQFQIKTSIHLCLSLK